MSEWPEPRWDKNGMREGRGADHTRPLGLGQEVRFRVSF